MVLTLSGCASLDKRLRDAAIEQGVAAAKINLPDRPVECKDRTKEQHAPLNVGGEVRTALKMERKAHERQQNRQDRCESFYDDVWSAY